MTYSVETRVYGNPDRGQDPNLPPYGVEVLTLTDETLSGLQSQVNEWQLENGIGSGNWGSPPVFKDGEVVGYMSFNGRVWMKNKEQA